MAAKAGAHAVDGKREGKNATAKKAASKALRESSDPINGKRRAKYGKKGKLASGYYLQELTALQEELVKLQYWVKEKSLKVAIVFEGRDAAGKGGVIKRIVERTNPRIIRVVALGVPTERERSQWYFQRWSAHLPAAGEIVLFDRSWCTRALTERVMGFCTEDEYQEFLRSCPQFERMLIRSRVAVLKYWFSVSDEEQERRFQARAADPKRRWKMSPMDIESRDRWVDYLSCPGFRGGSETRIRSSSEELRVHARSQEVSRGADRAWRAAGARIGPAGSGGRPGSRCRSRGAA